MGLGASGWVDWSTVVRMVRAATTVMIEDDQLRQHSLSASTEAPGPVKGSLEWVGMHSQVIPRNRTLRT